MLVRIATNKCQDLFYTKKAYKAQDRDNVYNIYSISESKSVSDNEWN